MALRPYLCCSTRSLPHCLFKLHAAFLTLHNAQEKSDVEPELPEALALARGQLTSLACELAGLQAAAGLPVNEEEYLREVLHPGLMQVRGVGGRACRRPPAHLLPLLA